MHTKTFNAANAANEIFSFIQTRIQKMMEKKNEWKKSGKRKKNEEKNVK